MQAKIRLERERKRGERERDDRVPLIDPWGLNNLLLTCLKALEAIFLSLLTSFCSIENNFDDRLIISQTIKTEKSSRYKDRQIKIQKYWYEDKQTLQNI